MKLQKLFFSSLCGLALVNSAAAQQTVQQPPNQTRINPQPQTSVPAEDSAMVIQHSIESCLSLDNQTELILAKLATEKGKDKDVIAFAKKMQAAHENCLADLKKIAPWVAKQQPLSVATNSTRTGTNLVQTNTVQTTTSNPATNGQANSDSPMLKMQAELAQQCLTDTEAWMTKDGSKDLDECYVGSQLAKHSAMHSKLTVFQRHTSGELNRFITDSLVKNKAMMEDSVALMKRLAENSRSSDSSE